jgi:predicted  nucleic acid-binding Zn-ribbon protein
MSRCANCGQPIETSNDQDTGGCASCGGRATESSSSAAATEAADQDSESVNADEDTIDLTESLEELISRLREYATIVGEDSSRSIERVIRGLVRGNGRPYRAEVNRLASRFLEQVEDSW